MACNDVTKWLFLNRWMSMPPTRDVTASEPAFGQRSAGRDARTSGDE
jgi:hypothetical protein